MAEWQAQTAGCKMGSGMYCTAWKIQLIFGNNCKWKVTFQHPVTEFLKIRNDILMYATKWMGLNNIISNEISQEKKITYCMVPFI